MTRIINQLMSIIKHLCLDNATIYKALPMALALSLVSSTAFCLNHAELTQQSLKERDKPKEDVPPPLKRVKENGGEVLIDGSLRVFEPIMGKVWDLVEVSTPVVAAGDHARLFLRADGTKQSLMIGWDDGTYTRIAGN